MEKGPTPWPLRVQTCAAHQPPGLREWRAHRGSGARKVYASALRFLYRKTLHVDWPIEHIPLPKEEHKLPVVLSRSEVERLLASVMSLKHRLMVMLLYATGLLVAELTHMQVGDLDRQRRPTIGLLRATAVIRHLAHKMRFRNTGGLPRCRCIRRSGRD